MGFYWFLETLLRAWKDKSLTGLCKSHIWQRTSIQKIYRKSKRWHQKTIRISEFHKVQDTKLIYRDLLCFYTMTTSYQKEKLIKQFHVQLHHRRIKYLGKSSTKEVKDLYSENYKLLLKETEDDKNNWKDILFSWIGRMLKCPYYPK